ncbi:phosphonate ABC transporter ATP-binding protein [Erysipelothrix sp. HDW6B]|uniref:phosphonate ABC transporter ATP-binding protein n=1 Tax=Erysipelothrix TaxID=1647 RepID=UPI001356A9EF|nr:MULTISPECIES: phosphonate ABC transporter ATP-binding protein [Erysipelothrix]QIK86916.1 phosphonate ABC transporter ATP-binding protein [Erysipelothrix sp. HDW6B]
MEAVLSMHDISMVYPNGTQALRDVNLTIYEGEFIAIIGPSGSGKSTLLRSINRLVTPTSGTLNVKDIEVLTASKQELRNVRSRIGMIFQNYNLVHRSSVLENVLHGRLGQMSTFKGFMGLYSEKDKRHAIRLLEDIGLGEKVYARADALSGGQMQRVGICRALSQNPDLMLADEPIASLDPKASKDVMDTLKRVNEAQGITTIANLHQVDVAKHYATRIIALKHGRIVFDDSPDKLSDALIHDLYENIEEKH